MGVCYLRLGFHACFPALLVVANLIAAALAILMKTPPLTKADIEAIADRAGTPDVAKRKGTELGFVKMFVVVPGRTLASSEADCHNSGCACYRHMRRCDKCALVLRCSWKLRPSP